MPTAIGINLGTQEIRVALFRGTPGRLRVASFHERTLPPQENRQAWLAALGPALQSLGREVRAGTAPIVVALPAQLAVLRTLTVPFARLADIDRVVKPQMEPFLAGPIEEVVVEYEVLKQSEIGSDLFVAAVPKADLRKILSALEAARLEPETVTLDIFGLAHLAGQTDTAAALENRLILDLGAGASKAVFLRQGKLFSARAFRASGLAATALIQQELGLSLEAAEAMKVDATDLAAISSLQLKSALTESYGRIAREVKMFLASLGEGGVDGVFLTGGGTRLKGISPLLALEGANVQIRPLALPAGTGLPPRLAPDAEKAATLLAVPLGSVLPRFNSGLRRHTLLREEFRPRPHLEAFEGALAAGLTFVTLLLALIGWKLHQESGSYQEVLHGLMSRQEEVWKGVFGKKGVPESGALRRLDARIGELEGQKQLAEEAPERRSALKSLYELLNHIPEDKKFVLYNVSVSPTVINLSGETDSLTSAQAIEQKISESPLLDCKLRNADTQEDGVRFQFEVYLKYPGRDGGTQ